MVNINGLSFEYGVVDVGGKYQSRSNKWGIR